MTEKKRKIKAGRVIAALLLFAAVIAAVWFVEFRSRDRLPEDFLFVVNGQIITRAEVEAQYNALTPQQKQQLSMDDVAKAMVERVLLQQAAEEAGFEVSDGEFAQGLQEYLGKNGLTEKQLQQNLERLGIQRRDFDNALRQELLVQELLDDEIFVPVSQVKAEEVQEAYDNSDAKRQGIPFEEVEQEMLELVLEQKRQQDTREFIRLLAEDAVIIAKE